MKGSNFEKYSLIVSCDGYKVGRYLDFKVFEKLNKFIFEVQ